jgi:hypothetical protein
MVYLPLPFGRPTGRLAAAAAAVASCSRCLRACHVALDLSPIDLRRWLCFGHPPHAEVEEAPVSRRLVGLGHFGTFPNGFTGPSSSFPAPNKPYFWAQSY